MATEGGSIYRSDEVGTSWALLGEVGNWVYDIAFDVHDRIYLCTDRGLYRSVDNGEHWSYICCLGETQSVIFDSQERMFVGEFGIKRSADDGVSWTKVDQYAGRLVKLPDGTLVSATPGGARRSRDGGNTWEPASSGLTSAWSQCIAVLGHTLLLGTDRDGVFRSLNAALGWESSSEGLVATSVSALARDDSGTLYAALWYTGDVYRSVDAGTTWNLLRFAAPWVTSIATPRDEVAVVGTFGGGAYRSLDGGQTWASENIGLTDGFVNCLAVDPAGRLFAGCGGNGGPGGVHRSDDLGGTWIRLDNGMGPSLVTALALASTGRIYAATDVGLYSSDDLGSTWTLLSQDTAVRATDGQCLLADREGRMFAGQQYGGLWRSLDGGVNWQPCAVGLMTGVNAIMEDGAGRIYAGGRFQALHVSSDGGESWDLANSGLGLPAIWSLLQGSDGLFYAGTGRGVYRSVGIPVAVSGGAPQNRELSLAVSPNPTFGSVTIRVNMARPTHATIRLYDVRGRSEAMLFDGTLPTGTKVFQWQVDSPGVHFCRVDTPNEKLSGKFVVLRAGP